MHRPSSSETSARRDVTRTGEGAAALLQVDGRVPDAGTMQTYEAAVALPMAHVMAATARLRAELRRRILAESAFVLPDWTTLRVTPPIELFDDEGRVVYRYRATVECDHLGELLDPTALV